MINYKYYMIVDTGAMNAVESEMPGVGGSAGGRSVPAVKDISAMMPVVYGELPEWLRCPRESLVLELEWRETRMGAKTKNYLFCFDCGRVLEPNRVRRSKAGTHGEDVYVHDTDHELHLVVLRESNRGNREVVYTDSSLKKIAEKIFIEWLAWATVPDFKRVQEIADEWW